MKLPDIAHLNIWLLYLGNTLLNFENFFYDWANFVPDTLENCLLCFLLKGKLINFLTVLGTHFLQFLSFSVYLTRVSQTAKDINVLQT